MPEWQHSGKSGHTAFLKLEIRKSFLQVQKLFKGDDDDDDNAIT